MRVLSTYSHGVLSSLTPRRNVVSGMMSSMISTSGVDEVADGVCSVGDAGSGRSSEGVLLLSSLVGDDSFFPHAYFFG